MLSKPRRKSRGNVTVTPVALRDGLRYQFTQQDDEQTTHENLEPAAAERRLRALLGEYRQALLQTDEADFQVLNGEKVLRRPPSRPIAPAAHDRPKRHALPEGEPVPFLVELGVMNEQGKVLAKRYDKFRQVNRFLEIVDDVLSALDTSRPLRIVDFGSGKSYLTFALFHWLRAEKGLALDVVGLDLKRDVVEHCEALARKLGYEGLRFEVGDIADHDAGGPVDLVVSLHACDTATDEALAQAVRWQAKVILAVPCCQHELARQLRAETLGPLLRHGALKERFAALATDSMRAQLLELAGYRTQILEFVDLEHTPKNLLIRAVRRHGGRSAATADSYREFRDALGADPALERALADRLSPVLR